MGILHARFAVIFNASIKSLNAGGNLSRAKNFRNFL